MNTESLNAMSVLVRAMVDEQCALDQVMGDETVLRHAVDVGLGPMLYRRLLKSEPHPWQEALRAQDLAARVECLSRLDALEEILTAVPASLKGHVLLLKGASLCQRVYQEPHLRMMGDIDLLVDKSLQFDLETTLQNLGYLRRGSQSPEFYDAHHHSMPFRHPRTGVVVEVHHALFRPNSLLGQTGLFQPGALLKRSLILPFRNFQIRHLDVETELAYLAAHWMNERRFQGTAIIPMMDMSLLLRQQSSSIHWDRFLDSLQDTAAAPHIRIALSYLHDRLNVKLPAMVINRLSRLSSRPGPVVDSRLHRLIDRYALAGTPYGAFQTSHQSNVVWDALMEPRAGWINFLSVPWRWIFPPDQARRYHPGFHWQRLRSGCVRFFKMKSS